MSEPSKISKPRTLDLLGRIKGAASLTLRAVEFGFYHLLLTTVDRVSRLPRNTTMPEAARLYRENIALKARLDALEAELAQRTEPAPTPMATRAAQVFAYLLTRGDEPFQRYFLSASLRTIQRWATRFRSLRRHPDTGGRPPLDEKVVELILTLKRENRAWGHRRIREELRRMGIRVSEPTIARILKENGFSPRPGRKLDFERVRSTAKDALWALDFFAVQTAKGVWLQALLIIDVHTRELLDLRVHDGWDVDSVWTIRTFNEVCAREKRAPKAVVHDHGAHFAGQFARQLRVLEIEEEVTPTGLPSMNCYAERAIGSVRRELLRHIRVADARELQFYLDEYRRYANTERPHQGIDGRTPEEFAASKPEAEVIDLTDVRRRRLERRPYANGILQGYALVADAPPAMTMTPADFTPAALLCGRRARAPFVHRPRQAPQPRLRARLAPTWAAWGRLSKGAGVVDDAAEEVSWDLAGGRSTPVDHAGRPPVLGSLSERRSASATQAYATNIPPRPAFNSARGDLPRARVHSRALGSTVHGTSPKQPGPGAQVHGSGRKREPSEARVFLLVFAHARHSAVPSIARSFLPPATLGTITTRSRCTSTWSMRWSA